MYTIKIINDETGNEEHVLKSEKAYLVFYSKQCTDKDAVFNITSNLTRNHIPSLLVSTIGLAKETLDLDTPDIVKALMESDEIFRNERVAVSSIKEEDQYRKIIAIVLHGEATPEIANKVEIFREAAQSAIERGIDIEHLINSATQRRRSKPQ